MKTIDNEEFVEAWVYAVRNKTGLRELAKKLDIGYSEASQHASFLRRAGVKLPTMPHPNQRNDALQINADPLNNIIMQEFGKESMKWRNR